MQQQPLKFVYFGTPQFSTLVLDELANAGYTPDLIVTSPDKPAGRGLKNSESPVKKWATSRGIDIFQPETYDETAIRRLQTASCELAIVAAYGKILPSRVLEIFPRGALNVHPSLLPKYRGTSPVESQILAEESEVGVSVILMDKYMDHGPILAQQHVSIPGWPVDRHVANSHLWQEGGKLLAGILPRWLDGSMNPTEQNHSEATLTKKISKEDGRINLNDSPRNNYLKYLAYAGWPGLFFINGARRVKITKATFTHGEFIVERVIPEGKHEMNFTDLNLRKTG
jgi:methionyl-tRNA formyltransferase